MTFAAELRSLRLATHAGDWLHNTASAIAAGFRPHMGIHALAFATYMAGLLQSHALREPVSLGLAGIASSALLGCAAGVIGVWLIADFVTMWRTGYAGSPTVALLRRLFADILTPGRISNGFHLLLAIGIFAIGFTSIKANIPRAQGFAWDAQLMALDKALHFGVLPHDLLLPVLGSPFAIFAVNLAYNAWFFVLMGLLLWQGFGERDTPLRQRFLMAYLLAWALGTGLIGTLLPSAGPCFYGRLVPGADPYAGLMSHLAEANRAYPVMALGTQEMLWQSYVSGKGVIAGISALPSLHVATSVIFFLCARAAGLRWLTWFSGIFAVTILLGSVLLAWHYAIDGYAGILLALACWWLAGMWVKRQPFPAPISSRPS